MPVGLSTQFKACLRGLFRPSAVGDERADDCVALAFDLSDGTGFGQADLKYFARRTLAANTEHDIDLAGALSDQFGTTLTMVKVKAIAVKNPSTNDNDLLLYNPPSNAWSGMFGAIWIAPGGLFLLGAPGPGKAVTPGTGDLLRVYNYGSVTVNYDIIIIATSA